ncbi:MAG: hypothetical protein QNJ22_07130 [Desulfosarcinaceae bacterium]|nr:hypothetical protein [Desulfosarcinaceae bacterium]
MAITVRPDTTTDIVVITYSASIDKKDVQAATERAQAYAAIDGCSRFLVDLRLAKESELTTLEILHQPKLWTQLGFSRQNKAALLLSPVAPPLIREDVSFLEITSQNRFWDVKLFYRRSEAIQWLQGQTAFWKGD